METGSFSFLSVSHIQLIVNSIILPLKYTFWLFNSQYLLKNATLGDFIVVGTSQYTYTNQDSCDVTEPCNLMGLPFSVWPVIDQNTVMWPMIAFSDSCHFSLYPLLPLLHALQCDFPSGWFLCLLTGFFVAGVPLVVCLKGIKAEGLSIGIWGRPQLFL